MVHAAIATVLRNGDRSVKFVATAAFIFAVAARKIFLE
jgi:hypothetical protein